MTLRLCALVACLVVAGGARAAVAPPIRIGTIGPLAEPRGDVLQGFAAYLRYASAHGGVGGRPLELTALDDGGDPAVAGDDASQLAADGVDAIAAVVGSDEAVAVRSVGVAQVLALGRLGSLAPVGYTPTDAAEGRVLARWLHATQPSPRVAVLASGLDGRELLRGFRGALGVPLLATASDVSQIGELASSGATTLCLLGLGGATRDALAAVRRSAWRPQVLVDGASALAGPLGAGSDGAITTGWARGFAPTAAGDPADALARRILAPKPPSPARVAGLAVAYSLVDALRRADGGPLAGAIASLREASNPFLLPGVTVRAGRVSELVLFRLHAGRWQQLGGVQAAGGP